MKHNQVRQVVFPIITAVIWGLLLRCPKHQHRARGRVHLQRRHVRFVGFLALLVVVQIFKMLRKEFPGGPDRCGEKAGRKDLILGGICCSIASALACNLQQLGMVARCQRRQDQLYHYALCGAGAHLWPVSQEKSLPPPFGSVSCWPWPAFTACALRKISPLPPAT